MPRSETFGRKHSEGPRCVEAYSQDPIVFEEFQSQVYIIEDDTFPDTVKDTQAQQTQILESFRD